MNDRRQEPRTPARELVQVAARVRPGHDVAIVDLSPSGALVEGPRPLHPGARVHMLIATSSIRIALSAVVVRSLVCRVHASHVVYRAALRFDEASALVGAAIARDGQALPGPSG